MPNTCINNKVRDYNQPHSGSLLFSSPETHGEMKDPGNEVGL